MNDERDKLLNQQGQESHPSDASACEEILKRRATTLQRKFFRGGNLGPAPNMRILTNRRKVQKRSSRKRLGSKNDWILQSTLHHFKAADQPNVPHHIKRIPGH